MAQEGDSELPNSQVQLYCGNLPFSLTTEDLKNKFLPFGALTDGFVASRNNRPRGFGFVTFRDGESAAKACEAVNGTNVGQGVDRRLIRVTFARVRPSDKPKRGGASQRQGAPRRGPPPSSSTAKQPSRRRHGSRGKSTKDEDSSSPAAAAPAVPVPASTASSSSSSGAAWGPKKVVAAPPAAAAVVQDVVAAAPVVAVAPQPPQPAPKAKAKAKPKPVPKAEVLLRGQFKNLSWPLETLDLRRQCGPKSALRLRVPLLAEYLQVATVLQTLNLSGNSFGDNHVTLWANGLLKNCSVTHLDLSNNNISSEGAAPIAALLAKNGMPALVSLNLSNNQLGSDGMDTLAAALVENSTLHTLLLERNSFDNQAAASIANVLQQNKTLTVLDVSRSLFNKPEGIKAIADGIVANACVKVLKMGRTSLGPDGAAAVAAALCTNSSITEIDLHFNKIGVPGATKIAAMLRTNKKLKHLNLQYNLIGSEGTEHLVGALAENTALLKLDLSYNLIKDAGAQTVARLVETSPTALTRIQLEENFISEEWKAKLTQSGQARERAIDLVL